MPQVNRFYLLPPPMQREIEQRLIENGFTDYVRIAAEIRGRGYRIGKSALHRYGQRLKKRFAALHDVYLAKLGGFGAAEESSE